jgi:hypothetical protein
MAKESPRRGRIDLKMWLMGYICQSSRREKRLPQRGCEPLGQAGYLIFKAESIMFDLQNVHKLEAVPASLSLDDTPKLRGVG